jgi:hypothetical protein
MFKSAAAPILKEYSFLLKGPAVPILKGYVSDRPHLYQIKIQFHPRVRPYQSLKVVYESGRTYERNTYLKRICKRPAAPISKKDSISLKSPAVSMIFYKM